MNLKNTYSIKLTFFRHHMRSFILPFMSFKCLKKTQSLFFSMSGGVSSLFSLYLCRSYVNFPISMLSLYLSALTCTPTPLHRLTVNRETSSQAPLKSAVGWPTWLYSVPQLKQLPLLRGPPANHILTSHLNLKVYIFALTDPLFQCGENFPRLILIIFIAWKLICRCRQKRWRRLLYITFLLAL